MNIRDFRHDVISRNREMGGGKPLCQRRED